MTNRNNPRVQHLTHELREALTSMKSDAERRELLERLLEGFCVHWGADVSGLRPSICFCSNDE